MKYTFVLLALLALIAFSFGCKPSDKDPMPKETIELDNVAWEYSQKFSLVRYTESPDYRDICIKIDGEDGSFLYLKLPQEYLDSIPSMPYEINGWAAYYLNASLLTSYPLASYPLEGRAKIQLLGLDPITHQLRLTFDAVVHKPIIVGQGFVNKHFKSGEILAIDFKEVNSFASVFDFEFKKDQAVWNINESGVDLQYEVVNWFFFSDESFPEASGILLNIPWGQALGTNQINSSNQIDSSNRLYVIYQQGSFNWTLESGELTLEENSFRDAKQKGRFNAVFHHPNFPDQKFQITEGRFEVSF
jgi:hypothetical protein